MKYGANKRRGGWMVSMAALLSLASAAQGADWPHWRGLQHDGLSQEKDWSAKALAPAPVKAWEAKVGQGYSAISVSNGRAYTMGNTAGKDTVFCLDAVTGKELWKHSYPCGAGNYPGPRATPTVDGERVYTLSREGHLFCLNASTGAVLWTVNVSKEEGADTLTWGLASSPVTQGAAVFINAGKAGMAFDKLTGRKLWSNGGGKGGYSTPVFFQHAGKPCAAFFGQKAVFVVDVRDGTIVTSYTWETRHDVHAADPLYANGKLFISSGYDRGATLIDLTGPTPKKVWEHQAIRNHFSSCVLINGLLYGVDGNAGRGDLVCFDWATGVEKWRKNLGFGSFIVANNKFIYLDEKGLCSIGAVSPTGFEAESQGQILPGKTCWTAPVLANGILYARDDKGNVVAVKLRR